MAAYPVDNAIHSLNNWGQTDRTEVVDLFTRRSWGGGMYDELAGGQLCWEY